ncbi:MAG: twin-arginine translocase TatA/TatE family subunit [Opitutaceae bacterium]|nr:twin-arginine translocase TatA/TatE family subunit [Opitutaceae bacterium]
MDFIPAVFFGIFGLGTPELIIILVILLVLLGGAKLPSLAKGLGQSIKEFKKASKDDTEAKADESKQKPDDKA